MRARRGVAVGVGALVLALLALRVLLPHWLRDYANDLLDRAEGYAGRVEDADLALVRGAWRIEGVSIHKEDGGVRTPLFETPAIDLSIDWSALLHGAVVGEVHVREPVLHVVLGPSEATTQTGEEADWGERLEALFPFRIDRLEIEDATLRLAAPHRDPPVDVALEHVRLAAWNWSNVRDEGARRGARARATGRLLDGTFDARLAADPLASPPDFALRLQLEEVDLRQLSDVLRATAGLDVQRGRLALYAEVASAEGRFDGYVKPLVRDLDVLRLEQEGDEQSLWASAWEALAGLVSESLENQPRDQLGTRIPLSGRLEAPEAGLAVAVVSLLRNGFVEALQPGLERVARSRQGGERTLP